MEEIILYSLVCVFAFFLINHAPLFSWPRKKVVTYLNIEGGSKGAFGWICRKLSYMITCIFCVSFWLTLIISPNLCLFVPVVATIINGLFISSFAKSR